MKRDFEELTCAAELFCRELSNDAPEILLQFMLSYEQELKNRPESKLKQLEELYKQSLHISYIMNSEIPKLLYKAYSDEIEAGLVAPLSAGKSTMLNAILGRRILPTACEAKTAVITRIIINPNQEHFSVRCRKEGEDWEAIAGFVTKEQVEHLNDMKDAEDLNGKRPVWEMVEVCGRVFRSKDDCAPRFDQIYPQKIFTDTPGINNAQNEQHKELTERLLSEENQNLLIFLFTAENFQTEDTKKALDIILKFLSDPNRLIFVCNRADEITMSYQEQYDQLKELLEEYGISRPNLFLVCAKAAELVRTFQYDNECEKEELLDYVTKAEDDALEGYVKKFACKVGSGTRKFVKVSDTSNNDPALYHFSALSKPQQMKIDEQVAKLRSEGTEEANWEITLLNSGVPALEMFLSDYMETQVVPVKLQHLVDRIEQKNLRYLSEDIQKELQKWEMRQSCLIRQISEDQKEIQRLTSICDQLKELPRADFMRGEELKKEHITKWLSPSSMQGENWIKQLIIDIQTGNYTLTELREFEIVAWKLNQCKWNYLIEKLLIFWLGNRRPDFEWYISHNIWIIQEYDFDDRDAAVSSYWEILKRIDHILNHHYIEKSEKLEMSLHASDVRKYISDLPFKYNGFMSDVVISFGCILFYFCDKLDAVTDIICKKAMNSYKQVSKEIKYIQHEVDKMKIELECVEERIDGLRKMIHQMEQFWDAIDHLLEIEPLDYGVRSK